MLRPNHLSNCVNMRDGFSGYGLLCIDRKTGERVARQANDWPAAAVRNGDFIGTQLLMVSCGLCECRVECTLLCYLRAKNYISHVIVQ